MSRIGAECLTDELFRQFLERRLPAIQLAQLQDHVDTCPDCMALLIELTREDEPARAPFPDQVDEYRLLRPLGRGAMGQVFVAHDTRLERQVALKLLLTDDPTSATRERFFVEARAIARLSHPNVVRIHRVGEAAGRPYLVSELVAGRSLDTLRLPLTSERVIEIGIGLCRGLHAAHQAGVLHRDIKPANAILSNDGEVKLLDFGLAKLQGAPSLREPHDTTITQRGQAHGLTQTGSILGTPRYMSPEQWQGQPATEQSDIYALGALLYELCAGRPPHAERTLRELTRAVLHKKIRPLRSVARGVGRPLSDVIEHCLARSPADRFATAEALSKALEDLRAVPAQTQPSSDDSPSEKSIIRKRRSRDASQRALGFVRRSEMAAVLNLLRRERLVVVAGDAGVGKSAFCNDAILPAVRDGALGDDVHWSVCRMTPGFHPMSSLTAAIAPWFNSDAQGKFEPITESQLLLFIDQAEELVNDSDTDEAVAMAELLGKCSIEVPSLRIVLAVRGEFLSRLAALPGLGESLTRALFLLRPLSAAAAFADVRRLHPGDAKMLRKLGAAYKQLRRFDAAAALLERAVEQDVDDVRARWLLALTHWKCGQLDQAIEQAREVLTRKPHSARAALLLGRLCLVARHFEQAEHALRQAVAINPDDRRAQRWLGEALLANHRAAEAVACFEKAAELGLAAISQLDGDA